MSTLLNKQDITFDVGFGSIPLVAYGALGIMSFIIAATTVSQITSNISNSTDSISAVPVVQPEAEPQSEEEPIPEIEPVEKQGGNKTNKKKTKSKKRNLNNKRTRNNNRSKPK
jgi:16S rRNA U1498 N3-methylase RsmE